MKKIYKKLTDEQRERGVIFSSCLSKDRTERYEDIVHEVQNDNKQGEIVIKRLKDDSSFDSSPNYNYNIIRT